jgi:hypothetical protein
MSLKCWRHCAHAIVIIMFLIANYWRSNKHYVVKQFSVSFFFFNWLLQSLFADLGLP